MVYLGTVRIGNSLTEFDGNRHCLEPLALPLAFFFLFFWIHIFSLAPLNLSGAYSVQYAPYLVFRSQIRRKELQNGQIGYGIALRRFCGLQVNVLQTSGARRFKILSSRTVIPSTCIII
jgi:hypothetical protein